MVFSEESFRELKKWWAEHGNPDIDVIAYLDNVVGFYDETKDKVVAIITKWDDRCHLDSDYPYPFTREEAIQAVAKFIKANNTWNASSRV